MDFVLGLEKEPKLAPELSPVLYKLILDNNLNPVKVWRLPLLLESAGPIRPRSVDFFSFTICNTPSRSVMEK